jgi:hypothetical protein
MVGGSFLASADTVFFGGNWTSVGGFSPSTGTVIYNGTGAGNVSISSTEAFYGFEVNGTGTLTLLSDIIAHNASARLGTLDMGSGNVLGVATDLEVQTGGILLGRDGVIKVAWNWDSFNGTWTPQNSWVMMTGIGASITTAAGQSFATLEITGQVSTTYASSDNLTVPAGGIFTIGTVFNITYYLYGAGTIQGTGLINHTASGVSSIIWYGAPINVDYLIYGVGIVDCFSDFSLAKTLTIRGGAAFSVVKVLKVAGLTFLDDVGELHQHPGSGIALTDLFINDSSAFAFKFGVCWLNISGNCVLTNSSDAIFEGYTMINGTLDIGVGCYVDSSGDNTFMTVAVSGLLQGWIGAPVSTDIIRVRYWYSASGAWDAGQCTVVFDWSGTVSMDPFWAFYRLRVPSGVTLDMLTNIRVNWSFDISGTLGELPFNVYINTTNSRCLMANGTFDGVIYLRGMASAYVYVSSSMVGWVNIENQTDFSMGGLLRVVPQNCTANVRITQYTAGGDLSDVICRWNVTVSAPFSRVNYTFFRLVAGNQYQVTNPDAEVFSGCGAAGGTIGFQLTGNGNLVLRLVPPVDTSFPPVTVHPVVMTTVTFSIGFVIMFASVYGLVFCYPKRKMWMMIFAMLLISGLFAVITAGRMALIW